MSLTALVLSLALGQSGPFVRSRVTLGDASSQCLFWTRPVIRWQMSSVANPLSSDAQKQNEFAAIRKAVQSWQGIFDTCGNLGFSEGPLSDSRKVGYVPKGDNTSLILFRSRNCEATVPKTDPCWDPKSNSCGNTYDCWDDKPGTIAVTLTTYDANSGIIYDSDIQLNAAGYLFTTGDKPTCPKSVTAPTNTCVSTDVQNTLTHELGHLVGLDHINSDASVMFPSANTGEISKRTIDDGSRGFVCLAYPQGQPSQSCFTPTATASSHDALLGQRTAGCASTGTGTGGLGLIAGALLAWRRRKAARS